MPVYVYSDPRGRSIERTYPAGKAPKKVRHKGRTYVRDIAAEHRGPMVSPNAWPMRSLALRCHPSQRRRMMEIYRDRGAPTWIDERGFPVITGRKHRNKLLEIHGAYDMDAGYGDRAPKNL